MVPYLEATLLAGTTIFLSATLPISRIVVNQVLTIRIGVRQVRMPRPFWLETTRLLQVK